MAGFIVDHYVVVFWVLNNCLEKSHHHTGISVLIQDARVDSGHDEAIDGQEIGPCRARVVRPEPRPAVAQDPTHRKSLGKHNYTTKHVNNMLLLFL
eukprot:7986641-Heterocapsa_arctica.AAC.1